MEIAAFIIALTALFVGGIAFLLAFGAAGALTNHEKKRHGGA